MYFLFLFLSFHNSFWKITVDVCVYNTLKNLLYFWIHFYESLLIFTVIQFIAHCQGQEWVCVCVCSWYSYAFILGEDTCLCRVRVDVEVRNLVWSLHFYYGHSECVCVCVLPWLKKKTCNCFRTLLVNICFLLQPYLFNSIFCHFSL